MSSIVDAAKAASASAPLGAPPDNPFVGPEPLSRGQPLYGRRRETEEIANLIVSKRIVLLFSPSGAGKTSLIRAGLIPKLEDEYDMQALPIVRLGHRDADTERDPSVNRYRMALLTALESMREEKDRRGSSELRRYGLQEYFDESVMPVLKQDVRPGYEPDPRDDDDPEDETALQDPQARSQKRIPLLILDQFEELFVDPLDRKSKEEFLTELGDLLRKEPRVRRRAPRNDPEAKPEAPPDPQIWALFAIREDRLAELEPFLDLVPTSLSFCYRLDALGVEPAREVIRETGRGWIGKDVPEAIVDDLRVVSMRSPDGKETAMPGPFVEPVHLQIVCRGLWDKVVAAKAPRPITKADVASEHHSEVNRTLAEFYDRKVAEAVHGTAIPERKLREWIEEELISPSGVRTQSLWEPNYFDNDDTPVRRLVDAHVLRQDQRAGRDWIELPHDRLVLPIREANHAWMSSHLKDFQKRAKHWNSTERNYTQQLLLTEQELKVANDYVQANPNLVTDAERNFIKTSEQALSQGRTRRLYRERLIWVCAAFGALLLLGGWAVAFHEKRQKNEEQTKARLEAERSDIYRALGRARESPPGRALGILLPLRDRADRVADKGGLGRNVDNAIRQQLTKLPAALVRELAGRRHIVWSLAFSGDGNRLFAGSWDGHISVQDLTRRDAPPFITPDIQSATYAVVMHDPGGLVASTHWDGRVRLWRWKDGALHHLGVLVPPRASNRRLPAAALSEDGQWLAAGGWDQKVDVWNVADPTRPKHVASFGTGKAVQSIAFVPVRESDGSHRLVSTDYDGHIGVWRIGEEMPAAPQPERRYAVAEDSGIDIGISASAVSPSGRYLVAGDTEGDMHIWDLGSDATKGVRLKQSRHRGSKQDTHVQSILFAPDAREFVSVGLDGYLVRWAMPQDAQNLDDLANRITAQRFKFGERLFSLAWRPGTRHQVAIGGTRSIYLLDLDRGPGPALSAPFPAAADQHLWKSIAMDASGTRIAARNGIDPIRVWQRDADGLREVPAWALDGKNATGFALTPDGGRLLTVDCHGAPTEWLLRGGVSPTVAGPAPAVPDDCGKRTAATPSLDPDGRLLATTDAHILRLWKRERGGDGAWQEAGVRSFQRRAAGDEPQRSGDVISAIAISAGRRYVAVGTASGEVYLLGLQRGKDAVLAMTDIGMRVRQLSFPPDGDALRTGDDDGYVTTLSLPGLRPKEVSTRHERSVTGVRDARLSSGEVIWITADADGYVIEFSHWPGDPKRLSTVELTTRGSAPINAIALSRDGRFLVTAGEDLLAWDLSPEHIRATAQSYAEPSSAEPKQERVR